MTSNESPNESSASVAAQASEWFVDMREGDLDAAGCARFGAWLRKSPEHIRAYMEVAALWEDIPCLSAGMEVDVEAVVTYARSHRNVASLGNGEFGPIHGLPTARAESRRLTGERSWIRHPIRIAAGVAGVAACLSLFTWWVLGRTPIYTTGIGEQRTVVLADGSSIELGARSSVRVQLTDARRDMELLSGQALFRVARDQSRPFVVTSNNTTVRAVGTQFDVHRRNSGTTVTVLEGRVAVMSELEVSSTSTPSAFARTASDPLHSDVPGRVHRGTPLGVRIEQRPAIAEEDHHAVYVSAGEQITVPAVIATGANDSLTDALALKPHPIDRAITAVAWSDRTLNFQDAPLADVVEEFNRYNQTQIVVTEPALAELRISGVFSANKPASLLRFLEGQAQVNVTIAEEQVRISPR